MTAKCRFDLEMKNSQWMKPIDRFTTDHRHLLKFSRVLL